MTIQQVITLLERASGTNIIITNEDDGKYTISPDTYPRLGLYIYKSDIKTLNPNSFETMNWLDSRIKALVAWTT